MTVALCLAVPLPISVGMKRMLPQAIVLGRLRAAGLRPTPQRLALAHLLLENGNRHVTAEQLHSEALAAEIPVSLPPVYNPPPQFIHCRIFPQVFVYPGRSLFDT